MIVSREEGKEEGQLSFPFLLGGGGRVLEYMGDDVEEVVPSNQSV